MEWGQDHTDMTEITQKKLKQAEKKIAANPIKIKVSEKKLPKPNWIRTRLVNADKIMQLQKTFSTRKLHTVCEEAACPNLAECFGKGIATFMILGDICTRRCAFCNIAHGRPNLVNKDEPLKLANTIKELNLKYVVITSVDRDDLRDGGAAHFVECLNSIRAINTGIKVEILTPDFRNRLELALDTLANSLPDVFNHNIETVPSLYKKIRPGADYKHSLNLLLQHKKRFNDVPTKSGLMLGLGEEIDEIKQSLRDLRKHDVDMLTLGQYLQPTKFHAPIIRYVTPREFDELGEYAKSIGFNNVASAPMVRSSYHADQQAKTISI